MIPLPLSLFRKKKRRNTNLIDLELGPGTGRGKMVSSDFKELDKVSGTHILAMAVSVLCSALEKLFNNSFSS